MNTFSGRRHRHSAALCVALATAAALAPPATARADVAIRVDNSVSHQTIEGFGATTISLAFNATDNVPPALRTQALDAAYNQVRLNMGNLEVGPFESPSTALYSPANDDTDPSRFNPAGFNWAQSDNLVNLVVNPARRFGFDNYYLGPVISETFEIAWARALRTADYNRYLDELAEHVAAVAIHWRDAYGITPRYMQLFNEPLSGNTELAGGSAAEMADIIKRAGARLRREGFASMQFVVPAEETEALSLSEATAILADPLARPYVGAIAYHPYPYGSTYAAVPNILSTSGSGAPDATKVAVRNQLRDLGRRYGIPVFMVEVSHSEEPFGAFDGMRGRAIHIHDEMVYADAAAFFGMNALWDSVTQAEHYAGRTDPGLFSETDTIVLIDDAAGRVYITEMGRAIGQYARWVPRGSVRVDASSDDALVQVTAFRDARNGRMVLVAINNATAPRTLHVALAGATLASTTSVAGEQSTATAYWQPIAGFAPSATGYTVTVPARSVTTYASALAGAVVPGDGGVVDGGPGAVDGSVSDANVPASDGGCGAGLAACGGACVDTASDSANCGACGNACAAGSGCVRGVCTAGAARDAEVASDVGAGRDAGAAADAGDGGARVARGSGCACRAASGEGGQGRRRGAGALLGGLMVVGVVRRRRRQRRRAGGGGAPTG